ncbi:MAG: hypothetical protein AB1405_16645 [Bdellovibrionota bacterium]
MATKLGDFVDELAIVGGLAPSLLVPQTTLPAGAEPHVGTMDLDLGLAVALLKEERYRTLSERLRRAGFSPDTNEEGNPTRQRWKIEETGTKVTVDFLISPMSPGDVGGKIRDLEKDFAAVITPGLHLAFQDRSREKLSGKTITGEMASREVWACGPGAYVVLKTLAFGSRGENKDAYDLFYVIRNYGRSVEDVAERLTPLLKDPDAKKAVEILKRDFTHIESLGPRRVAEFLGVDRGISETGGYGAAYGAAYGGTDAESALRADVVGFVGQLLQRIGV